MKTKMRTPWTLALAGAAVMSFGLVAAACGNDDDGIDDAFDDVFNGDDAATPTLPTDDGFDDGLDDGMDNGGLPGDDEVTIDATAVSPASVSVTAGSSVTVTNADTETHTVMVNGTEEGELEPGESMDVTFDEPGTYEVTTSAHDGMGAVVTVS
jgi:plastocyanin